MRLCPSWELWWLDFSVCFALCSKHHWCCNWQHQQDNHSAATTSSVHPDKIAKEKVTNRCKNNEIWVCGWGPILCTGWQRSSFAKWISKKCDCVVWWEYPRKGLYCSLRIQRWIWYLRDSYWGSAETESQCFYCRIRWRYRLRIETKAKGERCC